jgi:hypothetical protein
LNTNLRACRQLTSGGQILFGHSRVSHKCQFLSKAFVATDADAVYKLWRQACLLEVLFDEVRDRIKLLQKAINGIAHVVDRIDLHLKKQMRM